MSYNRKDMVVRVGLKGQKGYTMQDIGALDMRITNLEYYTVLNALSLTSQQLSITNANTGLERFKNGIFADPFTDSSLMRTDDPELNIAVSPKNSVARPGFYELLNEFELDTNDSNGVKATGKLLTLDYTNELVDGNPFATEIRNCTESYWNYKGQGYLFPDFYMGVDNNVAAPQNITVDNSIPFASAISAGGFQNIDTIQGSPVLLNSNKNGNITTNYYSQTATQTITDLSISGTTTSSYQNDNITSVASLPYMSPKILAFVATGLKPNTRMFSYFDQGAVYQYCAPGSLNSSYATNGRFDPNKIASLISTSNSSDVVMQNGNVGDPLYTNENGEIFLLFYLPGNTYRLGERVFTVCDSPYLKISTSITTDASATYTSSTLATTSQTTTYNIIQPQFVPSVTTKQLNPSTWTTTTYTPPTNNGGTGTTIVTVPGLGGPGVGGSQNYPSGAPSAESYVPTPPTVTYDNLNTLNSLAGGSTTGIQLSENAVQGLYGDPNAGSNSINPTSVPASPTSVASSYSYGVPAAPSGWLNETPASASVTSQDSATAPQSAGIIGSPDSAAAPNQNQNNSDSQNSSSDGGQGGQSSPGDCHVPWALVTMADQTKKEIQHIQVGDIVAGMNGNNTVIQVRAPKLDSRLVSFNGIDYFVSETHPLYTDKGWGAFNPKLLKTQKPKEYENVKNDNDGEELVTITEGSLVATVINGMVVFEEVTNVSYESRNNYTVYRLSVDGDHTYIAENYVAHNKE